MNESKGKRMQPVPESMDPQRFEFGYLAAMTPGIQEKATGLKNRLKIDQRDQHATFWLRFLREYDHFAVFSRCIVDSDLVYGAERLIVHTDSIREDLKEVQAAIAASDMPGFFQDPAVQVACFWVNSGFEKGFYAVDFEEGILLETLDNITKEIETKSNKGNLEEGQPAAL